MRPRRPRRRTGGVDDGVLPLINVVFLLLIFFMVAGRLAAGDPFRIEPTRAATGDGAAEGPLLLVAADGRLALDGAEIDRAGLAAALAGVERLRVKTDGRADSLSVVALIAELRAAGVTEARLMVEPKPGAAP